MCKAGEWVKGVGTDNHEFTPQQLGADLTYNAMLSSKVFPKDKVNYYSNFEITWYLSTSISGPWKEIGKSSNIMYITHEEPLDRARVYHTPLHIGCTKAMGEVYPEDIIKESFTNEFEDKQVALVGKTALLSYWGPCASINASAATDNTEALFKYEDGKCASWADFFQLVGQTQGIPNIKGVLIGWQKSTPKLIPYNPHYPNAPTSYPGLTDESIEELKDDFFNQFGIPHPGFNVASAQIFINEWCFLHPHTFYLNEEEEYIIGNTSLLPCNNLGMPAQGGINDPQSNFLNHAMIEYNAKYYDPSYGTTKESTETQNDWEDASLAGFGTEFPYPALDNNGVQKRVSLVWIQELNTAGVQTTFTNY